MTARASWAAVAVLAAVLAAAPAAQAEPFVTVEAKLRRNDNPPTIGATIRWNADAVASGMTVGDLRAVAVDADTTVPTLLAKKTKALSPSGTVQTETLPIRPGDVAALKDGNRVVLTATQHPPVPSPPVAGSTNRSYVTVAELQRGPPRGRVGSVDCSDRTIGTSALPGTLKSCDLVGAMLNGAALSTPEAPQDMHLVDLTGAALRYAGLDSAILDGGRAGGVDASGALIDHAHIEAVTAPRFKFVGSSATLTSFLSSTLDGARFDDSSLAAVAMPFVRANGNASFANTTLNHVDLAYARLRGADFTGAVAPPFGPTSLAFTDLTDATLLRATLPDLEEHVVAWSLATLCRTVMPDGHVERSGCAGLQRRR